jgi:hypothetical protein
MRLTTMAAWPAAVGFIVAFTTAAGAQVGAGGGALGPAAGAAGSAASRLGGTIGGAVGGVVGGTGAVTGGLPIGGGVGNGIAGGVTGVRLPGLSGPSGTIGASVSLGRNGVTGSGSLGGVNFIPPSRLLDPNGAASAAVQLERKQQVKGILRSVSGSTVAVQQPDGTTRTVQAGPEIASALGAFVGKPVFLRSADGVHVTSFVGQHDVTRGIVTALTGDLVTFLSPNGEVHSVMLSRGGASALHLRDGASVVAASNDFGNTAAVGALNLAPASSLLDAYVGTVRAVNGNTVSLGVGPAQQSFAVTPATARTLASLRGRTVALDSPDGVHVKSLLSDATVNNLVAAARGSVRTNAATASVLSATNGRLTLQLPDGDVRSYVGNAASLHTSARVPVTIVPLDGVHVRIGAGAHVATMADANACLTVNANCRGSIPANVVAAMPTSLSVQYPSGDVATYLGNVGGLSAAAGVPVTVTPLSGTTARIQAGAQAANLVDAKACVTINAGCRAMPGTVSAIGPGTVGVTLADGNRLNLGGNGAGLAVNAPVIVQPLDGMHAILQAGGQVADVANAGACVTVNAVCGANGTAAGAPLAGAPNANGNGIVGGTGVHAARTIANAATAATPNTAHPTRSSGTAGATAGTVGNTGGSACASVNGSNCAPSNGSPGNGAPNRNAGGAGGSVGVHAATASASARTVATPNAANSATPSGNAGMAVATRSAGNPNSSGCVTVNGSSCTPGSSASSGNAAGPGATAGGTNGPAVVKGGIANGMVTAAARRGGTAANAGASPGGVTAGAGNGSSSANAATGNGGATAAVRNGGATLALAPGNTGGAGNGAGGVGTGASGSGNAGGANGGFADAGNGNGAASAAGNADRSSFVSLPVSTVSAVQIAAIGRFAATCSQDGQIVTRVTDIGDGRAIPNARVLVSGLIDVAWHTDAEGTLRFLKMPVGTYRMTVTSPGYGTLTSPAFGVDCANAANLGFKLAPARSHASGPVRSAPRAGSARRSAVVVESRPRLPSRAVARVAARNAVCARRDDNADGRGRAWTVSHARREVKCSR